MGRLGWRALVAAGIAAVAVGALAALVAGADQPSDPALVVGELERDGGSAGAAHALGGLEPEGVEVEVRQVPGGILTATSAGPVELRMTRAEVRERLTAPAETFDVSLSGGPAPQENWTWHLPDGDFTVYFDTARGTVAGFIVSTPAFGTVTGARVGEPFAPIQEAFGKRLRLSPIGSDGYILSPGEPGSYPALTFWVPEATIEQIQAGNPGPAGE